MISLVIVSHSRALADAAVGLARQMAAGDLPIAVAAGSGPDRQDFGTDAVEIAEAIQAVFSEEGVVVIMDLGSAILSAEMAREFLPPEMAEKVYFCPAPFVEGTIAAAVQASLGSSAKLVCREASQALQPKIEQLSPAGAAQPAGTQPAPSSPATAHSLRLVLRNAQGLHARPAARFVQTAGQFDADVRVTNLASGKGPVSARSLNAVATLAAGNHDEILVSAEGPQAEVALQALKALVEDNFGEREAAVPTAPPAPAAPPSGNGGPAPVAVSEGIAIGPLYRYQPQQPVVVDEQAGDPDSEWRKLQIALEITAKVMAQRREDLRGTLDDETAAIFDAHLLILQDPELLEQVEARIRTLGESAGKAWQESIQATAEAYRSLSVDYLAQRAADVIDVGNQVLFALAGKPAAAQVTLSEPVILFAEELTPTETAGLDMQKVLGLVTLKGGPTSHSAILARALGIPALTGVSPEMEQVKPGTLIGVDGFEGKLWIDPTSGVQADLRARLEAWQAQRRQLLQTSQGPAVTRDGRRVEIAANIGSLADAHAAMENGAEAVGLLRTEFLFLSRSEPPTEDEQAGILKAILEAMQGRPVIVRTLDVGGDKALPYIDLPQEDNPFLGVRAIRMSLRRPELFMAQLRAILRAGTAGMPRIMFPMVTNLAEVQAARAMLEQAHQELETAHVPHAWPVETGIMIEVPAAALMSDLLAGYVDFFSIGTNDLTQYTLAAERGNPGLADFADGLHPAVLNLIGRVADAAHRHGKWTGICGELGGDPLAAPILVGLGVDELSLNPAGIPRVKQVVRDLSYTAAQHLARQALQAAGPHEVRRLAAA